MSLPQRGYLPYNADSDPTDWSSQELPIVPVDPCQSDTLASHDLVCYDHVLRPLSRKAGHIVDFPFQIPHIYLEGNEGRQRIFDLTVDDFIALYNHSDWVKMHCHNQHWLGNTEIDIVLPPEFFVSVFHFYAICGSVRLGDLDTFNYLEFLLVCSYMMINEDLILWFLRSTQYEETYETNTSILPACYFSSTVFGYELVKRELFTKFRTIPVTFLESISKDTYSTFKRGIKGFLRHNDRFDNNDNFTDWRTGLQKCSRPNCEICLRRQKELVDKSDIKFEVADYYATVHGHMTKEYEQHMRYQNCLEKPESNDKIVIDTHYCSISMCKPLFQSAGKHIYHLDICDVKIFNYYSSLSRLSKMKFRLLRMLHNKLNADCLEVLCDVLKFHFTREFLITDVIPFLSNREKKLIKFGVLPVNYLVTNSRPHQINSQHFGHFMTTVSSDEYETLTNDLLVIT